MPRPKSSSPRKPRRSKPAAEPVAVSREQARKAKDTALRTFRKLAEVVGVGITRVDHDYAVKVNLREAPDAGIVLPTSVDGVPVRVEVTGPITAR